LESKLKKFFFAVISDVENPALIAKIAMVRMLYFFLDEKQVHAGERKSVKV
jgi:hypothetical protein